MTVSRRSVLFLSVVVTLLGVMVAWELERMIYSGAFAPVEVETTYGPIKLTLRLNKTTYKLGEPVNMIVNITNISNETIVLGFTSPPAVDFWVYNESSAVVYKYYLAYGWHTGGVDVVLNPEESFSLPPSWIAWDQVEIEKPPRTHRQVQPGTYYIAGRTGPGLGYLGPLGQYRPGHYQKISIETPKIRIRIF